MIIPDDYLVYPTRLSGFRWFPRKWFIEKGLNVESEIEESVSLKMGKLQHSINERFFSEINPDLANTATESHFLDVVKFLHQDMKDYTIPAIKVPEIDEMCRNFAIYNANLYRHLLKENKTSQFYPMGVEVTLKSKNFPVAARIDRINKSFNGIDYKTDKIFPKMLFIPDNQLNAQELLDKKYYYESLMSQAVFAAILIEEHYGKLPEQFLFMYLRHLNVDGSRGMIPVSITQEKVNMVKTWVNEMLADIRVDNFPSCRTKNPKACYKFNAPCLYRTFCDVISLCIYEI